MCCCWQIFYNQEDFKQQRSLLQELYEDADHLCLYYPKFHCELNFIEQYWGNVNFWYWETPFTNSEEQMLQNMHECLDSVLVDCIWWYAVMTLLELSTHWPHIYSYSIWSSRFMHSYCTGLDGPQAAWACRKYQSHCTLPPATIQEARAWVWI